MKLEKHYPILVAACGLFCLAFTQIEVGRNSKNQLLYRLNTVSFLSPRAKKELKSGISTRVMILVQLVELPNKVVKQQAEILDSKYDLWDEIFYVTDSAQVKEPVKSQVELENMIEAPGPFPLGPAAHLKKKQFYQILAIETVNPINTERFIAVQKWITQRKLSFRGLPVSKDTNSLVDLDTPLSALFYTLWKRASSGELLTGELRVERQSEVFSSESLPDWNTNDNAKGNYWSRLHD